MYEDIKEYLNWYDTRKDVTFAKDAPIIGLVLQRSHLVTGDEGHYSGVVSEMEARGAKVGSDSNRSSCQAKRALVGIGKAACLKCVYTLHRVLSISVYRHMPLDRGRLELTVDQAPLTACLLQGVLILSEGEHHCINLRSVKVSPSWTAV